MRLDLEYEVLDADDMDAAWHSAEGQVRVSVLSADG